MFSIAYGNDDDWRLKCSLWKLNFANSVAELAYEHRLLLGNIEKTIEEKIEIIDGTREKSDEDSESARKDIKQAWNETYKEERIELARTKNLFITKVKEDKQSLGNRKRKDSPTLTGYHHTRGNRHRDNKTNPSATYQEKKRIKTPRNLGSFKKAKKSRNRTIICCKSNQRRRSTIRKENAIHRSSKRNPPEMWSHELPKDPRINGKVHSHTGI